MPDTLTATPQSEPAASREADDRERMEHAQDILYGLRQRDSRETRQTMEWLIAAAKERDALRVMLDRVSGLCGAGYKIGWYAAVCEIRDEIAALRAREGGAGG